MVNVWVYRSRNGNHGVFEGTHEGFERARTRQDHDNLCTVDDAIEDGIEGGGSYEEGHFYIDDGGSIELMEVE